MWTNAQYDNVTIWWPVWTDVQFGNMTIWRSVWQSDNLKVSCEILDMEVRQCEGLCEQMFNIEMSPSGGLWGQMFNMGKRQYEGPWTMNKRLCVIDTMDRSSLPIPYHDLTFYPSHASDSTRPPQRPKCIFPIRSRHHFQPCHCIWYSCVSLIPDYMYFSYFLEFQVCSEKGIFCVSGIMFSGGQIHVVDILALDALKRADSLFLVSCLSWTSVRGTFLYRQIHVVDILGTFYSFRFQVVSLKRADSVFLVTCLSWRSVRSTFFSGRYRYMWLIFLVLFIAFSSKWLPWKGQVLYFWSHVCLRDQLEAPICSVGDNWLPWKGQIFYLLSLMFFL